MKTRLLFGVLLLLMSLAACSNKADCLTADTIKEITAQSLNEKGVHLFLRSSGFNEKVHFYEMFKGEPTFDECGQTKGKLISQIHVDTSIGKPKKLIVKSNQIELVYTDAEGNYQLENISVEVE
jgi:hypothetical protein